MYVVTVDFEADPDHVTEFRAAVLEQASKSLRLEEGCHVFDVCEDIENAASFYLYEKYTNADAFNEHLLSAHFKSFDDAVAPWVVAKSVSTWNEIGDTK